MFGTQKKEEIDSLAHTRWTVSYTHLSEAYFRKVLDRVRESVDASNTIVGEYMCQGRMPQAVKAVSYTHLDVYKRQRHYYDDCTRNIWKHGL